MVKYQKNIGGLNMIIQSNNESKITLRTFSLDDVEEFYQMVHSDLRIKQYVPYAYVSDITETVENVEVYEKCDCVNDFYLIIEIDGKMVGAILAIRTDLVTLDISQMIFEKYRGQGIMKESIEIFANWLKNNTKYENMSFVIKKDNVASLSLAQKLHLQQVYEGEKENLFILKIQG